MGKLFGTDGIRGIANKDLAIELAFDVGMAAAAVLSENTENKKPLFTIGMDTRISGPALKSAFVAGLCSAGADVLDLGVIPTPAVAWITADRNADAGVVISASHNPFEYNGIKIFDRQGYKLPDELENEIENIVSEKRSVPLKSGKQIGTVADISRKAVGDYIAHLVGTIETEPSDLKILVDCANGAASMTAPQLFHGFSDLKADMINSEPNGININDNCGSTHMERICELVKAGGYDFGIAFDGDADRCLTVDENGNEIDGDKTLAICGDSMIRRGILKGNTIVGTVMSNMGLRVFAREHNLNFIATPVGDRNVLEEMRTHDYCLGGEQSGHTIFLDYATTGDGELTALQLLQILCRSGKKASELADTCKKYPQVLLNIEVKSNEQKENIMNDTGLAERIAEEEKRLNGKGRILVRPSGTERLIRVMVEGEDPGLSMERAKNLTNYIKSKV